MNDYDREQAGGRVLVLFLASHVRLVHFDWTGELALIGLPCVTDAVSQMPRRLLRDAQVSVKLHA